MQKRNRIHENISLCVWLRIDAVKTVRITFIYTHQGDCVCCIFFFSQSALPTNDDSSARRHIRGK